MSISISSGALIVCAVLLAFNASVHWMLAGTHPKRRAALALSFVFFSALSVLMVLVPGAVFFMLPVLLIYYGPWTIFPTLVAYGAVALLSAMLASFVGLRRRWGVAAGVLVLAIGVPLVANRAIRRDAEAMAAGDHLERGESRPRSIEFASAAVSDSVGREPLRDAPCDAICQRLLLGREADWVRVRTEATNSPAGRPRRVAVSVVYRLEARPVCVPAFAEPVTAIPEMRHAQATGTCLVPDSGVEAVEEPAGAVVTTTEPVRWIRSEGRVIRVFPNWRRRIEVELLRPDAEPRKLAVRTETVLRLLRLPLIVELQDQPARPVVARVERSDQPTDVGEMLRETLGYRLGAVQSEQRAAPAEVVAALLNRPPDAAPLPEAAALVAEHMRALAERPTLTAEDTAIVGRVIGDRRMGDGGVSLAVVQVLRRHRDLAAELVPVILERLAVPVDERVGHTNNQYGWVLARLPAEAWRPYRDQILAILERDRTWVPDPLLTMVGRLGTDPVPLIRAALSDQSQRKRSTAAYAACRADPEWHAGLAPVLIDFLRVARRTGDFLPSDELAALKALRRFGQDEEAEAFIQERYGADPERAARAKRRVFDAAPRRRGGSVAEEPCSH